MEEAGGEKGCEARGWREQGPAEEGGSARVLRCPATGCFNAAAAAALLLHVVIYQRPQQHDRGTARRALPCAIGSVAAGKPAVRAQQVLAEPRQPGAEHPSAAGCPMFPW